MKRDINKEIDIIEKCINSNFSEIEVEEAINDYWLSNSRNIGFKEFYISFKKKLINFISKFLHK